jgi:hypothetical protein
VIKVENVKQAIDNSNKSLPNDVYAWVIVTQGADQKDTSPLNSVLGTFHATDGTPKSCVLAVNENDAKAYPLVEDSGQTYRLVYQQPAAEIDNGEIKIISQITKVSDSNNDPAALFGAGQKTLAKAILSSQDPNIEFTQEPRAEKVKNTTIYTATGNTVQKNPEGQPTSQKKFAAYATIAPGGKIGWFAVTDETDDQTVSSDTLATLASRIAQTLNIEPYKATQNTN